MTQRIFDIENEKDMADLWDILPEEVVKIEKDKLNTEYYVYVCSNCAIYKTKIIKINWHDKTEITRPIQEATEHDVDKICCFWNENEDKKDFGILAEIGCVDKTYRLDNKLADGVDGEELWYDHCRRLTKQEIEELC